MGPDSSAADRFIVNSVRTYGPVWENALTKLWADLSLSIRNIAERLGISRLSVTRHAIRLKLPMNGPGLRSAEGYERHQNPRKTFTESLTIYRERWIQIINSSGKTTRNELIQNYSFIYLWLNKNDKQWLETHLPAPVKAANKNPRLDWNQIDKKLSSKIGKICKSIRNLKDKPVRVSLEEIIRRYGHRTWLEKRDKKLPLTAKIINDNLESLEDYMIRKIRWAENEFLKENICPSIHQLERRASVRNKVSQSPVVQRELNKSLSNLRKILL